MTRRRQGTGTVERRRGQYRARLPDAARTVLGTFPSEKEANEALDDHISLSEAPQGDSLATYGPQWLDRRELAGIRGSDRDRARWRVYVATWSCYGWPMSRIRRGDVRRWAAALQARKLADQTCRNALNLLRCCFRSAMDDELIDSNPAEGVRIHARGNPEEVWSYLDVNEQRALLAKLVEESATSRVAQRMRWMIQFAIGTGLRWGEQRTLELADVHLEGPKPFLQVKRSVKREQATKNRKARRVPLFGLGLEATRALVELCKHRENPRGLLCVPPKRYGDAYISDDGPSLGVWLRKAGIDRHVRWHDLRHTCASSLVAGWWGRRWPLIAVRDFLGHSSITITERYAHLAGSVVEEEAAETRGLEPPRSHLDAG